jgi:hypothetical protein
MNEPCSWFCHLYCFMTCLITCYELYMPHGIYMIQSFISGSSFPLIFCIHVRSGPIYWGGYLPCKKIIRWWYFTCKKPENIICDGILHVNMFHDLKIPYFTCTFFTKFTYNEYIGPYFIVRCSTIFCQWSPRGLNKIALNHGFAF